MKRINDWLIDQFGHIHGSVVDEEGNFVTPINTSRVVKREGNIVTTRSGSHYELLNALESHMGRYILDKYFNGAPDALAAIDYRIINHD